MADGLAGNIYIRRGAFELLPQHLLLALALIARFCETGARTGRIWLHDTLCAFALRRARERKRIASGYQGREGTGVLIATAATVYDEDGLVGLGGDLERGAMSADSGPREGIGRRRTRSMGLGDDEKMGKRAASTIDDMASSRAAGGTDNTIARSPPTTAADCPRTHQTFPFMELPAELRLAIYRLCLKREKPIVLHLEKAEARPEPVGANGDDADWECDLVRGDGEGGERDRDGSRAGAAAGRASRRHDDHGER